VGSESSCGDPEAQARAQTRDRPRGWNHVRPECVLLAHVRVYCDDPWPISLVYPIRALRHPTTVIPPERLVDALQSLADGTRLELLRLTARRPRSTQELAVLLSLSEAAVSRNLRMMATSGLLQSRREGRYVLYSCVKEALEALTPELIRLVEGGAAKNG
jgi:DNA-binding transcriptional ArsR family regulator